jgi:hypothetical protein
MHLVQTNSEIDDRYRAVFPVAANASYAGEEIGSLILGMPPGIL